MNSIRKKDGFKNERHVTFPIKNFPNYLKHPLVNQVYISEIGYYPDAKNHYRERLDGADEAILIFCMEGRGTVSIFFDHNWHSYKIEQGDIFCILPKTPHIYFSDNDLPWTISWIHFNSHLLETFSFSKHLHSTVKEAHKKDLIESYLINLFMMESRNFTLDNAIFMASLLNHLLITIQFFEDNSLNSKKDFLLTTCIQYMNQNLNKDLSLTTLSKRFNISSSYLNAIFKEETNKSPIDFFIKLKMDEACSLLRISKMKINEIALTLGYTDPYYFSRIFKKTIGASPKSYREQFNQIPRNFESLVNKNK